MKKILSLIFALVFSVTMMSAQVTTKNADILDNWFVGANVGAVAPMNHSFDWGQHGFQAYRFEWGVEAGKWVTPVVGLGVTYEAQVNTTKAKTAFDCGTVLADVHFNLTNLFAGYTGEPRAWEFELIPSVGFIHYYGDVTYKPGHRFFAESRLALSADYNFGKNKQWMVYVRPGIQYVDRIRDTHGQFDLRAGVTYKFKGRKSGSHNFVKCPYSVTQEDYDAVVAALNALKNEPAKVVTQTVEVVKEVPVAAAVVSQTLVVNFAQGKSELTADAKDVLDNVTGEVAIVASASPEGGKSFNQTLSEKRAAAVKAYLEAKGVKVTSAEGVGVTGANSNRIAIVTVK